MQQGNNKSFAGRIQQKIERKPPAIKDEDQDEAFKLLATIIRKKYFRMSKPAWQVDIKQLRDDARAKGLGSSQWANFIHSAYTAKSKQ